MELNYSKIFNREIIQTVSEFCKLNNIEDIDGFIKKCFISGLNIEKYGLLGKTLNEGEKQLIKEVIVEKRVEIPVEIIKEVVVEKEIIKEVPIEIIKEIVVEKEVPTEVIKEIIKEVPVEKVVTKIEYISDKTSEVELSKKITKLEENIFQLNKELDEEKQLFSTKTTEMENNFHYEMSKKEKELDELRQTLDNSRQTLVDDNKVKMLQQTIQNLNSEIRDLKKKNEELNKKLLEQPKQNADIPARFHGGSNLNDDLYK